MEVGREEKRAFAPTTRFRKNSMLKNKQILQILIIALAIGSFSLGLKMGKGDAIDESHELTDLALQKAIAEVISSGPYA